MTITVGASHSRVIRDNRINENTALEMLIFNVHTGETKFCAPGQG